MFVNYMVFGFVFRQVPVDQRTFIQGEIIQPLLNTFLGFLNAVAGPMIFLSVVWGIYSVGDASTFSDIGKRRILTFGVFLITMSMTVILDYVATATNIFSDQCVLLIAAKSLDMIGHEK